MNSATTFRIFVLHQTYVVSNAHRFQLVLIFIYFSFFFLLLLFIPFLLSFDFIFWKLRSNFICLRGKYVREISFLLSIWDKQTFSAKQTVLLVLQLYFLIFFSSFSLFPSCFSSTFMLFALLYFLLSCSYIKKILLPRASWVMF